VPMRDSSTDPNPVSSPISRTAVVGNDSPGSTLPFGSDQSSYRDRCATAQWGTPSCIRYSTAPAAGTTRTFEEDFALLADLALLIGLGTPRVRRPSAPGGRRSRPSPPAMASAARWRPAAGGNSA